MKVNSVFLLLIFALSSTAIFSQQKITWKELTTIYRKEYLANKTVDKPAGIDFNDVNSTSKTDAEKTISLKDMEGKKVTIRGYFLDLGADSIWYFLSRFPFENCFFCTGVGPETVIELGEFENEKSKFKTDDIVTVTGTLFLIKEDGEYMYILNNCTVELYES